MNSPDPDAAARLEDLEDNEPPVCERCGDEYSLDDGKEPTKYCHPCAQERVIELEAALIREAQQETQPAPKMSNEMQSQFKKYSEAVCAFTENVQESSKEVMERCQVRTAPDHRYQCRLLSGHIGDHLFAPVQPGIEHRAETSAGRLPVHTVGFKPIMNQPTSAGKRPATPEVPPPSVEWERSHLAHVQRFLVEMYQTMVDPVEDFKGNIAELCTLLLKRAREDREALNIIAAPAAPDAAARLAEERKEFERWVTKMEPDYADSNLERLTGGRGGYRVHNVAIWWMAWQARAALIREAQQETLTEADGTRICPMCRMPWLRQESSKEVMPSGTRLRITTAVEGESRAEPQEKTSAGRLTAVGVARQILQDHLSDSEDEAEVHEAAALIEAFHAAASAELQRQLGDEIEESNNLVIERDVLKKQLAAMDEPHTVEDGFGSVWPPCEKHDRTMQVMRPGNARCPECESDDYFERQKVELTQLREQHRAAEAEVLKLRQELADEYSADKQTQEQVEKMQADLDAAVSALGRETIRGDKNFDAAEKYEAEVRELREAGKKLRVFAHTLERKGGDRWVCRECYAEGATYKEIAHDDDCEVGQAESVLGKGRG